jgi:GxxExxY protein
MHEPRQADGDRRTFEILGAAMAVHRTLGCGFLEAIYREALGIEFGLRRIPFEREVPYRVHYKGHRLGGSCRVDFLCFDAVIVEIKARSATGPADAAQVLNYLASSGHPIALLLNFGTARLDYRRYILTNRATSKTASVT